MMKTACLWSTEMIDGTRAIGQISPSGDVSSSTDGRAGVNFPLQGKYTIYEPAVNLGVQVKLNVDEHTIVSYRSPI